MSIVVFLTLTECLGRIQIRESILEKSLSVPSLSFVLVSFIVSFIRLVFGREFRRLDLGFRAADGFFVIFVKNALNQPLETKVMQILSLRDLYYQKGLLETMLRLPNGVSIKFDDRGLRQIILPPNVMAESILEKQLITLRHVKNITMVMDWHSTFRDAAEETLKLAERGRGF